MFLFQLATVALAKPPAWVRAEPFSVPPSDLRDAAEAMDTDEPVLVLLDEEVVRYDGAGRRTLTTRLIWRLDDESVARGWGGTEASWAPWRQERPLIRARVIAPDGSVVELDDETLVEEGVQGDGDPTTYSDNRKLRAPLPRIEVGAIIEEQITWTDSEPYLGGGGAQFFGLQARHADTQHLVRRAEVAAGRPMTWTTLRTDIKPKTSTSQGVRLVTVHLEDPSNDATPSFLPPNVAPGPHLVVVSSDGWASIGDAYTEMLDGVFDPAGLETHVDRLKRLPDDEARVKEAYKVARDVRYTGIEFGAHAVVPYTPAKTLERGYGDCKDKATLLVTLLDQVGIEAHLALVRATSGYDNQPEFPTPTRFNHAIVYIPSLDRWLDPTDSLRPADELPWSDQGRWALVIDPGDHRLVQTPARQSTSNRLEHQRTFDLQAPNGTLITDRILAHSGFVADTQRRELWDLGDSEAAAKPFAKWTKDELLGTYTNHTMTDPTDVEVPFDLTIHAEEATLGMLVPPDGYVNLSTHYAYTDGAPVLFNAPEEEDPLADRELPFAFHPHLGTSTLTVDLPEHYVVVSHPPDVEIQQNAVSFRQSTQVLDDKVVLEQRFDGGSGRLTGPEATAFRDAFVEFLEADRGLLLQHHAAKLFEEGDQLTAFAELRSESTSEPTQANPLLIQALLLAELGLRDAAVRSATRATELAPASAFAHQTLGDVHHADAMGRPSTMPFDRAGAVEAYERTLALEPNNSQALNNLAVVLEHGDDGFRWGRGVDFERIDETIERLDEVTDDRPLAVNQAIALLALWRCKEAREAIEGTGAEPMFAVAATACLEGAAAARKQVNRQVARAERSETLDAALLLLTYGHRETQKLAALRRELADGLSMPDTSKRVADNELSSSPGWKGLPDGPARSYFQFLALAGEGPDQAREVLAPAIEDADDLSRQLSLQSLRSAWVPLDIALDLTAAIVDTKLEGSNAVGWKLDFKVQGQGEVAYLLGKKDGYLVRALNSQIGELAEEALDRAERGDVKGAAQWLAWAAQNANASHAPKLQPFLALYAPPKKKEEAIRQATLLALVTGEGGLESIGVLQSWAEEVNADEQSILRMAALLHVVRDPKASTSAVEDAFADEMAFATKGIESLPLSARGLFEGLVLARTDAVAALEALPDTSQMEVVNLRVRLLASLGRFDEAEAVLADAEGSHPFTENQLAWYLLAGPSSGWQKAREYAQRGFEGQPDNASLSALHTFATATAMLGDLEATAAARARAAELAGRADALHPAWSLVEGWMLHHLGLDEDAAIAFGRLPEKSVNPLDSPDSRDLVPERYR